MPLSADDSGLRADTLESHLRIWLWRLAPVLAGILLRLDRVGAQMLVGDELHGVSAAARMTLREALTTYLPSDGCIPLTGLFRELMNRGFVLGEPVLRAPSLVAGCLVPLVLPWMLEARVGRRTARWLAWLLAVSPTAVLYSRIVRPYAIVSLLGGIAVIAFWRWWSGGSGRSARVYTVVAPLAVWFHLSALPFLGAPVVYGWISTWFPSGGRRSRSQLATISFGALALVVGFLAPTLSSGTPWIRNGGLGGGLRIRPDANGLLGVLQLLFGVTGSAAAIGLLAVASCGLVLLARRDREFAGYSLALTGIQVLALFLLAPIGLANPEIFDHYLLVTALFPLLWIAVALAEAKTLVQSTRAGAMGGGALAGCVIALLVAGGPLLAPRTEWSSFLHLRSALSFDREQPRVAAMEKLPLFYRRLIGAQDGRPIVEYLGSPTWNDLTLLAALQDVHRRPVLYSPEGQPELFSGGLALRHLVEPTPAGILGSPARWLVVHRDFALENQRLRVGRHRYQAWLPAGEGELARARSERFRVRLLKRWGPADYRDGDLEAWDLDRLRTRAGS